MTWVCPDDLTQRIDAGYYQPIYVDALRKLRSAGQMSTLGLISPAMCNGPHGNVEYVDARDGVLYLRAKNIHELTVNKEDPVFISKFDHRLHKRGSVRPGDILITITGANIGACGVVPEGFQEANIIQSLAKLRVETGDDPRYIAAFLDSRIGQLMIRRESVNTAREGLNFDYLANIPILLCDPALQHAIGNILLQAERLREMCFYSWVSATTRFEQSSGISLSNALFANVTAVENDSDYQCASISPPASWVLGCDILAAQYYHPRRIHSRKMASNNQRWQTFAELATPVRSRHGASTFDVCIGLDQIDSRLGVIFRDGSGSDQEQPSGIEFRRGRILFSRLRPYLNKVAIWPPDWPVGTGSGELLVYECVELINEHYLFFVLKSPLGLYQVLDVTAGSTLPRVDSDVVDEIRVPRLPEADERSIGESVRDAHRYWYESGSLVLRATSIVESLIDGTLDESKLISEGNVTEQWLKQNPSPSEKGRI